MTLHRVAGFAALIRGATCIAGFVLLVAVVAPPAHGRARIDALALVLLAVVLSRALEAATPGCGRR